MSNIHSELKKVWDKAPKEIRDNDKYIFVISADWKNPPSQFYKKLVCRTHALKEKTIYYMLDPIYLKISEVYENLP